MEVRVWHDEFERWKRTGRLDEGPCWCAKCVAAELESSGQESTDG